jgi:hypothetical protein
VGCLKKAVFSLLSLSAMISASAQAATLYKDQLLFSNQVSRSHTITFDDTDSLRSFNNFPLVYEGLSLSVDHIGYNATGNSLSISADELGMYSVNGTRFAAVDLVGGATFTLTFGNPVQAFGASFVGLANGGRTEIVRLLNTNGNVIDSFQIEGATDDGFSKDFFGFTSDAPFAAISINHVSRATNDVFGMDNLIVSTEVAAVPEPATWGLMVLGFGMMAASMRYRRRHAKAVCAN